MALLALLALLTFVLVILFVAAKAIKRRFTVTLQVAMAAAAFEFAVCMRVAQLKFGEIVVEPAGGGLPVAFGVAICTTLTQGCFVLVVFFMAAVAVFRRFLEHCVLVTVFALNLHMLAQQRKTGLVVIEPGRFFPAAFAVTATAVASQRLLVFVIGLVTGITICA